MSLSARFPGPAKSTQSRTCTHYPFTPDTHHGWYLQLVRGREQRYSRGWGVWMVGTPGMGRRRGLWLNWRGFRVAAVGRVEMVLHSSQLFHCWPLVPSSNASSFLLHDTSTFIKAKMPHGSVPSKAQESRHVPGNHPLRRMP